MPRAGTRDQRMAGRAIKRNSGHPVAAVLDGTTLPRAFRYTRGFAK
jgi:hypothetical protein